MKSRTNQNPNKRPGQPNRRPAPKNNNKPLIIIIMILVVAALAVGIFFLLRNNKSDDLPDFKPADPSERIPSFSSSIKFEDMLSKMEEAKKVNDDTIGWITIPGTNIDDCVLSPSAYVDQGGNSYYIFRELDGTDHPDMNYSNWVETPFFTSWRNNFDALGEEPTPPVNKNYVIFGHNWTNFKDIKIGNIPENTMFAQLPSYTDINFATENPYVHFSTFDHHMVWKIAAVFYTEPEWQESMDVDFNYITPGLTPENFERLIQEFNERTIFNFDTGLTKDDYILTLSTCTRMVDGAGEDQRFVVVARLLRDGESDTDAIKITENPNPKAPIYK